MFFLPYAVWGGVCRPNIRNPRKNSFETNSFVRGGARGVAVIATKDTTSSKKTSFSHVFGANSAFINPTGENRPRRFRKRQREHRLGFCFKSLHFSINLGSTPPTRTRRGEIDPVDSENDNESVDCQKPPFSMNSRPTPLWETLREAITYQLSSSVIMHQNPCARCSGF